MVTQVAMWGNSLAIRIPKALAAEVSLGESAEVNLSISEGKIILTPVHEYTLEGLLAAVTEENLHGEIDTGAPVGNETW